MLFNPFKLINPGDIENKVQRLRRENPGCSDEELGELVIREGTLLCALSGVLTTLPAVFPVLGTLVALLGGIAVDISLIAYFMMRMIMELSVIYGRNIYQSGMPGETVLVFASAVGVDAVSKTIGRISTSQMGNQTLVRLVQQGLLSLGVRSTSRVAVRIIPVIGAGVAGVINYYLCRKIGRKAREYYSYHRGERVKETIDVEGNTID